jgi:gas vesicle protein
MSDEGRSSFGLICFLAGAAIGAGLALLYAPQSGAETRKKIKDTSEKVADEVKHHYEKVSEEAKKAIETVKVTAEKAISNVKNFIDGAKESMKKEIKEELKEEPKAPEKKKVAAKA